MAVQTQIQTRRGTAATWTSTNPTLAAGEIGFESDTNKFKIGTGSTAWTALAYAANTSPLTTKGDLYTYSTTNDRLAVGNNGETLVADSSTSTGLRYQSAYNGNIVINGGMDIWQRGTSFTASGQYYAADRMCFNNFTVAGRTVTRQLAGSTLPQFQYCTRIARDSGNTNTTNTAFGQALETTDSLRFAGQTVTLSFYARAGANYSGASNQIGALVISGTGTDQNRVTGGYTGEAFPLNQNVTLTTSWQRFTVTGNIASTTTELTIYLQGASSGTAGANDYYEVTGIQLELGSVATTFKRAGSGGGTIQGELAACQRYYQRAVGTTGAFAGAAITGVATSNSAVEMIYAAPVQFRTAPTVIDVSGMAVQGAGGGLIASPTSITIDGAVTNTNAVGIVFSKSASFTSGAFFRMLRNNNVNDLIGFGAEL